MKKTLLLALPLLLGVSAGWAQEIQYKPDFEVTLVGGYQFGGSMDETVKHEGVSILGESLGIKGSEFAGVIVNYRLGPELLLELSYDRQFTTLDYHDANGVNVTKLADLNVDVYHAGLMYNWASGEVQPYVGGTIGMTSMTPNQDLSSVRRFSVAPVLGLKVFSSQHFAFRFQTRLLVTSMPKDQHYFYDGYQHTLNSYMIQIHFMLGVTIGL
ncbi:MAG: hypothetical protein ACREOO_16520 [bacterium]